MKKYLPLLLLPFLLFACQKGVDQEGVGTSGPSRAEGARYVFDDTAFPEVHISVKLSDWNAFLKVFDRNNSTKKNVVCSIDYVKGSETTHVDSVGFRLRGRSSRQRPEGEYGQSHKTSGTDWHHFHFGLNFNKYIDGSEHSLKGQRKIWFKWPNGDGTYMREHYCFDLFQKFDVWFAPRVAFSKVFIQVEGDAKEAYLGVFNMIEPLDGNFVKMNGDKFGGNDGFLWKCSLGAQLTSAKDQTFGYEIENSEKDYTYELKTNVEEYETALAQFKDFIQKLNKLEGVEFFEWMNEICDVEQLLKMYAANVTMGMWDDYWGNANNYFLYFNSQDAEHYKVYMLPYDYDNALGTAFPYYVKDPGTHDPLDWGPKSRCWIYKILQNTYYKNLYISYLKELIDPANDYFYYDRSQARIDSWVNKIKTYVSNDTGEDMEIKDEGAYWSSHPEYRILSDDTYNFFKVRTATINQIED